jgi:hypothetical protein
MGQSDFLVVVPFGRIEVFSPVVSSKIKYSPGKISTRIPGPFPSGVKSQSGFDPNRLTVLGDLENIEWRHHGLGRKDCVGLYHKKSEELSL